MLSTIASWKNILAKLGLRRKKRSTRAYRSSFTRRLEFETMEARRVLSAVTVNTTADIVDAPNLSSIAALIANPGADGQFSLRESIQAANADTTDPFDTITFDSSLNGAQIVLNLSNDQINITDSLTIDASMLSLGITIDADDPTFGFHNNGDGIRIFNITDPSNGSDPPEVTLIGMTLRNSDPDPGGAAPEGGAIRSEAILTLRDMVITENGAGSGGGVYVAVAGGGSGPRDVLTIENSQIVGNAAWTNGGGVFVRFSSTSGATDTVRITDSSLSNNVAGPLYSFGLGGGLHISSGYGFNSQHAVIITSSTLETNEADTGGAIYHQTNGSAQVDLSIVEGSYITGNTATTGSGGGIYSRLYGSRLQIDNSTVSGNAAAGDSADGGGVFARLSQSA